MKESNSVEAGKEIIPPIETPVGKLGLLICFDLRFPEISLRLRRQGAQVLAYPSAFTGKAHWETLLRARAIESQVYIIAAAQCGRHDGKRMSYGDSIVVGPWGEVVGRLDKVEDADAEREREGDGGRNPQLFEVVLLPVRCLFGFSLARSGNAPRYKKPAAPPSHPLSFLFLLRLLSPLFRFPLSWPPLLACCAAASRPCSATAPGADRLPASNRPSPSPLRARI